MHGCHITSAKHESPHKVANYTALWQRHNWCEQLAQSWSQSWHDDPVYPVNSCFTQIFEWQTKNTLFITIFPRGCTEFPKFSMLREIPEYSRFVATLLSWRLCRQGIPDQQMWKPTISAIKATLLTFIAASVRLIPTKYVSSRGWQLLFYCSSWQ